MNIAKRLNVTARTAHVLLREQLLAVGWLDIYSDAGAGSFGLVDSGADGETDASAPQVFTSPTAAFTGADVGRYLVLGSTSPLGMQGCHRIVAVTSATTCSVASGLYGSQFSTAINLPWRVVNPTLNTGVTEFVVQAPEGTSTPAWQCRFYLGALDTDLINIDASPYGGYSIGLGWTQPIVTPQVITQDTTPLWYFCVNNTHVQMWTEANSGAAVFEYAYVGSCTSVRPDVDDHFVVACAGALPACLGVIASLAADGLTQVDYEALEYVDPVAGDIFTNLPNSPYDLKRDFADIAVGCTALGYVEGDRGVLRNMSFVSSLVAYRTIADNGRIWLSLGSGIAVAWDGSIAT